LNKKPFFLAVILSIISVFVSSSIFSEIEESNQKQKLALAAVFPELFKKDNVQFDLADLTGKRFNSNQFKGKTTIINFWATWCAPCIEEMPGLIEFYKEFGEKLNFLSINVDEKDKALEKFLKRTPLPFLILRDPKGKNFSQNLGIKKYPETIILSPSHKEKLKIVGPRDWKDQYLHYYFEEKL